MRNREREEMDGFAGSDEEYRNRRRWGQSRMNADSDLDEDSDEDYDYFCDTMNRYYEDDDDDDYYYDDDANAYQPQDEDIDYMDDDCGFMDDDYSPLCNKHNPEHRLLTAGQAGVTALVRTEPHDVFGSSSSWASG